jgi:pyruvate ferredoxin oxidoreductase beta subunit
VWRGKRELPKDLISIMIAHRVPYIATASPAFLKDMEAKLRKAMEVVEKGEGLAYVHIQSPCPTGWRFSESKTVEVARKAVLTGAWPLLEVDHGVFRLTVKPSKLMPLKEYVRLQGRFAHLSDRDVEEIQRVIEDNWRRLLELHGKKLF